jgi:hypothetical protein
MKSLYSVMVGLVGILVTFCANGIAYQRFHLKNKTKWSLTVTLYGDSNAQKELKSYEIGKAYDGIEVNNNDIINQIKSMKVVYAQHVSDLAKTPNQIAVAFDIGSIKPEDATYYLSFDLKSPHSAKSSVPSPIIEIQKGTLKGLKGSSGKTTQGYSLKNNVRRLSRVD